MKWDTFLFLTNPPPPKIIFNYFILTPALRGLSTNRGWEPGVGKFLILSLSLGATMKSSTKRSRRKTQREAAREKRQRDTVSNGEVEETEIVFQSCESRTDPPSPVPRSPPGSPSGSAYLQYEDVLDMFQNLHNELGLITLDNDVIMRMQTPSPMPSQNYTVSATHRAPPGVDQWTVRAMTVGSWAQKVLVGGYSNTKGPEAADIDLHGFRQP